MILPMFSGSRDLDLDLSAFASEDTVRFVAEVLPRRLLLVVVIVRHSNICRGQCQGLSFRSAVNSPNNSPSIDAEGPALYHISRAVLGNPDRRQTWH